MARTRPSTEQVRFRSDATGEHILEAYIEAAELGGRTLADLMQDVFTDQGALRSDLFQWRVKDGGLQTRTGDWLDPEAGWVTVSKYFDHRGLFEPDILYDDFDTVSTSDGSQYLIGDLKEPTSYPNEDTFIAAGHKLILDATVLKDHAAAAAQSAADAKASATAADKSNAAAALAQASATTAVAQAADAQAFAETAAAAALTVSKSATDAKAFATKAAAHEITVRTTAAAVESVRKEVAGAVIGVEAALASETKAAASAKAAADALVAVERARDQVDGAVIGVEAALKSEAAAAASAKAAKGSATSASISATSAATAKLEAEAAAAVAKASSTGTANAAAQSAKESAEAARVLFEGVEVAEKTVTEAVVSVAAASAEVKAGREAVRLDVAKIQEAVVNVAEAKTSAASARADAARVAEAALDVDAVRTGAVAAKADATAARTDAAAARADAVSAKADAAAAKVSAASAQADAVAVKADAATVKADAASAKADATTATTQAEDAKKLRDEIAGAHTLANGTIPASVARRNEDNTFKTVKATSFEGDGSKLTNLPGGSDNLTLAKTPYVQTIKGQISLENTLTIKGFRTNWWDSETGNTSVVDVNPKLEFDAPPVVSGSSVKRGAKVAEVTTEGNAFKVKTFNADEVVQATLEFSQTGTLKATSFEGDGSKLTNLPGSSAGLSLTTKSAQIIQGQTFVKNKFTVMGFNSNSSNPSPDTNVYPTIVLEAPGALKKYAYGWTENGRGPKQYEITANQYGDFLVRGFDYNETVQATLEFSKTGNLKAPSFEGDGSRLKNLPALQKNAITEQTVDGPIRFKNTLVVAGKGRGGSAGDEVRVMPTVAFFGHDTRTKSGYSYTTEPAKKLYEISADYSNFHIKAFSAGVNETGRISFNKDGRLTAQAFSGDAWYMKNLNYYEVGKAMAGAAKDRIGNIVFAKNTSSTSKSYYSTIKGSELKLAGEQEDGTLATDSTVLTGTWRCMGYAPSQAATLWIKQGN